MLITAHSFPKCLTHHCPTIPIWTRGLRWHWWGLSYVLFITPAMELVTPNSFTSSVRVESGGVPFEQDICFSRPVTSCWEKANITFWEFQRERTEETPPGTRLLQSQLDGNYGQMDKLALLWHLMFKKMLSHRSVVIQAYVCIQSVMGSFCFSLAPEPTVECGRRTPSGRPAWGGSVQTRLTKSPAA